VTVSFRIAEYFVSLVRTRVQVFHLIDFEYRVEDSPDRCIEVATGSVLQNGPRREARTRSKEEVVRLERRRFLKLMGGAASSAVALGSGGTFVRAPRAEAQVSLTPFVDALPIPAGIHPSGSLDGEPLFLVTMQVIKQRLHRDLPPSTLWAYNGQYPGPTFEAQRGQPIAVRWMNNLPSRHMFPIDRTLHGDEAGQPEVRTVVHLHGHKVLPESDGYPEAWFTNGFGQTGPFFEQRTYNYRTISRRRSSGITTTRSAPRGSTTTPGSRVSISCAIAWRTG